MQPFTLLLLPVAEWCRMARRAASEPPMQGTKDKQHAAAAPPTIDFNSACSFTRLYAIGSPKERQIQSTNCEIQHPYNHRSSSRQWHQPTTTSTLPAGSQHSTMARRKCETDIIFAGLHCYLEPERGSSDFRRRRKCKSNVRKPQEGTTTGS
jgi:hypothetical protein